MFSFISFNIFLVISIKVETQRVLQSTNPTAMHNVAMYNPPLDFKCLRDEEG